MNSIAKKAGQGFIRDQVRKREGYIISAPNKDERGKKLNGKAKLAWEKRAYELEGIPQQDIKILLHVKAKAKALDAGHSIGPLKYGKASVIGMLPLVGDFADILLAYYDVYLPARKISKGDDLVAFKAGMKVRIVCLGCIGSIPMVGDFADTLIRWNMRNAAALEKLLLTRAGFFEHVASAKATKSGGVIRRQRLATHHSDESSLEPPPRYEDALHGSRALSSTTKGTTTYGTAHGSSKIVGGWLAGLKSRNNSGKPDVVPEPESAPERPPRPVNATPMMSNQF